MGRYWPYLVLLLPPLFWAGNFIVGRAFSAELGAITMSFYRWLLALCLLAPFAYSRVRQELPIILNHLPILTVLALLSVASFNVLLYLGLRDTEATNALLINSSIPVWIVLFGVLFYNDSLTLRRGLGILVSLLGVSFLIFSGQSQGLTVNPGDLWVISSSIGWALYSLTLRKKPSGLSGLGFLAYIVLFGVCFNGLLLAINPLDEAPLPMTLDTLYAVGYVAIFASLGAYVCWNYGVGQLGAQVAGQYIHLMPFYGVLLASLFLNESLSYHHWVAGGLIATGLILALRQSPHALASKSN
ncbi:MAG TPA: EamA/RhaT family transporter [Gammaproteobacteria bacterium]|jgi:drug/metabolite transporter (DMT)-like permease|nr:DMT family transporter [Litorivicinus sp.]MDF1784004.1 DMT family transporter [Litorivicinaceae bacterium]HAY54661.1 EamA/RhaT family transporter [Gammaproteobacteria bacterium]